MISAEASPFMAAIALGIGSICVFISSYRPVNFDMINVGPIKVSSFQCDSSEECETCDSKNVMTKNLLLFNDVPESLLM